ncbi:MAG: IPTL-CTERM sorting domain-containing protein [Desulfobacteraceae bacterium]|nr:IPTL-CTERM sorting domain-containing protein [Desulfobacteraceae bacterium]MBC2757388.1 IPTL-CTERM sorting domain-containing protein [Desulfobacteraceae bacterium]
MKHKGIIYPLLLILFIFISSVSADELVLQPDGATGKDAMITTTPPDNNFGSGSALTVNYGGTSLNHGLIEFNLSAIPIGATIDSVTLELFEYSNCGLNQNLIEAHLNSGSWDETTVTWNSAPAYDPAVLATNTGETAACDWLIFDVSSAVTDWVNGTPNYGFRITGPASGNVIKFIPSSDYTTPADRPILRINYTTAAPQSIPTLNEWGMIVFMLLTGIGAIFYLRKNHLSA